MSHLSNGISQVAWTVLEAVCHVVLHTLHIFLTAALVHANWALLIAGFFWLFRRPGTRRSKSTS